MSNASYRILPIHKDHIPALVDVHMEAFPDFFLTFLGPKFLKEFYESFLIDDMGIGFVAQDQNTNSILGGIVGPLSPQGYFKRLVKRRWWAFCLASITAVIKKPSTVKRLFRAFFYRGDAPTGPQRSLLSSIAVDPGSQGHGIGKALILIWMDEVKARGSSGCYLTTDTQANDAVNRFYQKIGMTLESTFTTPEGREMNLYVYDFKQAEKSDIDEPDVSTI